MDLFLAISQGTGLAIAVGVRPFLPPLLAGALARADLGIDFDGSDYAFLESIPFLAGMVVITVVATAGFRFSGRAAWLAVALVAAVLGALEFGGSLAGEDYAAGPGLAAGVVCALVGYAAARSFLTGAESRLVVRTDRDQSSFLVLYADAAALALAAIAILLPPLSYVALALCAWVVLAGRRRAQRKYEGLRVLR
jgi:hypothetical protein